MLFISKPHFTKLVRFLWAWTKIKASRTDFDWESRVLAPPVKMRNSLPVLGMVLAVNTLTTAFNSTELNKRAGST